MKITDLAYDAASGAIVNPWRADLQRARFRSAYFHVEANAVDSGRRVVMHEFPKKNLPYAEDMGRRFYEFTVRGYCIQYPFDMAGEFATLYQRDYRIARDILVDELTSGDPGPLYLPTFAGREVIVICSRYRLTEEQRTGGYCTFDMTFQELGVAPSEPAPDSRARLIEQQQQMRDRTIETLSGSDGGVNV